MKYGSIVRRLALVGLAGPAACSTGDAVSNSEVLAVISTRPAANAVGASASATIEAVVDGDLDPSAVSTSTVSVFGRWSGVAEGVLEVGPDRVVRFRSGTPFMAGEMVTVSLTRDIRDLAGRPLRGGFSWSFYVQAGTGSLDLQSAGTRSVRQSDEGRIQTYGAYAGDLDGDGYSDLSVPNELSNDMRVFLNNGSGDYDTFSVLPIASGSVPSPNEGADFNRDGLIDVAVGNAGNDLVSIFLGSEAQGLVHAGNYVAGNGVRGVCPLDANADGYPDIATANQSGSVSLLINDGQGRFATAVNQDVGSRGEKTCAVGDANADGIPDLFVGAFDSNEIVVFRGDGDGRLEFVATFPAGGSPWMIAAGDVNGDGWVDVVSANAGQHNMAVLLGDGAGGLGSPTTYPVGRRPIAIDLGDLDGDGDLDAVTSNFDGADFTIYENVGGGVFGNRRTLLAAAAGSCAILHDRDNDGDLDITGIDEVDDLLFLFENRGS